ncbi:MAG: tetratricopeptide repeat protein [Sedimentisphaerales bacterium]
MMSEDDKLESMLADPWLAKPGTRWPLSILFVLVALFALKPIIVDRLISRAEAYSSNRMFNNAERQCQKAIFLDGNNARAWNLLGGAYKSQGDIQNAVNTYLNAINANPANKVAHFRVAMIFALEKDYHRAIPHFELIRILGPESPASFACDPFSYYRASLVMLSLCYEKTDKPDKIQDILKDLARTHPGCSKDDDLLQIQTAK